MGRSFVNVEMKVAEADFFFEKLRDAQLEVFAARCYLSAFLSSCRSITFALQGSMKGVGGFEEWYEGERELLRSNEDSGYFNRARRLDQHLGLSPLSGGSMRQREDGSTEVRYRFAPADTEPDLGLAPAEDVVTAARTHLGVIVKLVLDCCIEFRVAIDPKVYYRRENFEEMGQTIHDAEEEVFGVSGAVGPPGATEDERWEFLRSQVSSIEINALFEKYLGRGLEATS